jgi:hypothetical protein
LANKLKHLEIEDCTCAHEWRKCTGRLYGISTGPGWVRTSTEPECPQHGTVAEEQRRIRNEQPGIWPPA